jgi:ribosomal protein L14E/L6E/L27E
MSRVVLGLLQMPFKRYIEIGRVCVCNYGSDYGKLVVIVDVVDQQRVCISQILYVNLVCR